MITNVRVNGREMAAIVQVFISAPFRGKNQWEIHQSCQLVEAHAAEIVKMNASLWHHGVQALPVASHLNSRNFYGLAHSDDYWLAVYLDLMLRCDMVSKTGEHEASTGCALEDLVAREHNKPIFYTLEGLYDGLLAAGAR